MGQPDTYTFPMNEDKRRFCHEWLKIFPWLAYSEKFEGAFWLTWVLFGAESTIMHNTSKLQRLFILQCSSVATARFRDHSEKSELDKTTTVRASLFKSYMEKKITTY